MTADKHIFSVTPRDVVGKKVSVLRKQKQIPANISGHSQDSLSIVINRAQFDKLYREIGDTGLIYLDISGKKKQEPVLVDDVQNNPMTGETMHVVFKRVSLTEKVSAAVPVELIGENKIPDTTIVLVHSEIEVEAFPTDLPDHFEIDISTLTEIGQSVTMSQLEYDKDKVTIIVGEDVDLESEAVVILQEVKEEVIEETPEELELPETTAQGNDTEEAVAEEK